MIYAQVLFFLFDSELGCILNILLQSERVVTWRTVLGVAATFQGGFRSVDTLKSVHELFLKLTKLNTKVVAFYNRSLQLFLCKSQLFPRS